METSDDEDSRILQQKYDPVGKSTNARSAPVITYHCKAKRSLCDSLYGVNNGFCKAKSQFWPYAFLSGKRRFEFRVGLWKPNTRMNHRFFSNSALTCSQGIALGGFWRYRSRRDSISGCCSSVTATDSASTLSHRRSSNSNFSAVERFAISVCKWLTQSLYESVCLMIGAAAPRQTRWW